MDCRRGVARGNHPRSRNLLRWVTRGSSSQPASCRAIVAAFARPPRRTSTPHLVPHHEYGNLIRDDGQASVCRLGEYSIVPSCQTRVIGLDRTHGLALGETMADARLGMRQAPGNAHNPGRSHHRCRRGPRPVHAATDRPHKRSNARLIARSPPIGLLRGVVRPDPCRFSDPVSLLAARQLCRT